MDRVVEIVIFADHFPLFHLNQSRDYHELKREHSRQLVGLSPLFLHQLKSRVNGAFLNADHFVRLHLNQARNCAELKGSYSIKLDGSGGMFGKGLVE
jgi:hypothetical protein